MTEKTDKHVILSLSQDLKKQIPKRVRNDKRKSLPSRGGCHVSDRWGLNIKVKPEKNTDPTLALPSWGGENRKVHSPVGGREKIDAEINSA